MDAQTAVEFENVDIVFSETEAQSRNALTLLDQGQSRSRILDETGSVIGVAGATLDVKEGEICVLMGLSGSGKSTLLRAVNGLNTVTRGSIRVRDGDDMLEMVNCSAADLRRMRMHRVAMVFQQFGLLPWRTVEENVGLGLELRGVAKEERHRIVEEKLKLVQLDKWASKYAHELSGGMQQRVGLARAFATDAELLLMDEPFSALDPLIRTHLQDELLDLQQRLKKTIIFVSHDLDEALKIGNRIAIMEEGRVVQYGEPEQIVLNPASDYVAEFVAHMNPLDVLRGGSLMTHVADLRREGDDLLLDSTGRFRLQLDAGGAIRSASADGNPVRTVNPDEPETDEPVLVIAPADLTMRRAIELRYRTGTPVAFIEDGKLVGICGDEEIYRGILRQANLNRTKSAKVL
jgi:glycine betaine/proline transport system ATP-binding protein